MRSGVRCPLRTPDARRWSESIARAGGAHGLSDGRDETTDSVIEEVREGKQTKNQHEHRRYGDDKHTLSLERFLFSLSGAVPDC